MRIKKHSNGNEYLLTADRMWVRNYTKPVVPFVDINRTIDPKDHFLFLKNEVQNNRQRYPWIDAENIYHEKAVIVADGHDFAGKQELLARLPADVVVIGVLGALARWAVPTRGINYYVVNNPYPECMRYLPRGRKSLPRCVASNRTNWEFLAAYRGTKYRYYPVNEVGYSGTPNREIEYQIDDHRNSICAAVNLAYRFGVEKLLLFCCDNSFRDERPGAVRLENGLWEYPQQAVAHGLVDGMLYWFRQNGRVADHSGGSRYENAEYIAGDEIGIFFGG